MNRAFGSSSYHRATIYSMSQINFKGIEEAYTNLRYNFRIGNDRWRDFADILRSLIGGLQTPEALELFRFVSQMNDTPGAGGPGDLENTALELKKRYEPFM